MNDKLSLTQRYEKRIAELEAKLAEARVKLWDCPSCGFAFDAAHKGDENEQYPCPVCNEIRLSADNQRMEAQINWLAKTVERLLFSIYTEKYYVEGFSYHAATPSDAIALAMKKEEVDE